MRGISKGYDAHQVIHLFKYNQFTSGLVPVFRLSPAIAPLYFPQRVLFTDWFYVADRFRRILANWLLDWLLFIVKD